MMLVVLPLESVTVVGVVAIAHTVVAVALRLPCAVHIVVVAALVIVVARVLVRVAAVVAADLVSAVVAVATPAAR